MISPLLALFLASLALALGIVWARLRRLLAATAIVVSTPLALVRCIQLGVGLIAYRLHAS